MRKVSLLLLLLLVSVAGCARTENESDFLTKESEPNVNSSEESGTATDIKPLSEMDDSELRAFLEEYVSWYTAVPQDQDALFYLLKNFLPQFDTPGETYLPLSAAEYATWSEEIDKGVLLYYGGISDESPSKGASYTPVQNSFWQIPDNMYVFRCYGYAIGLYATMNPGFSVNAVLNMATETAQTLANYVKTNLQSSYLGQNCVKITTVCPSASILSSGKKAICIRKGAGGGSYDYHLMKLTASGWLHKPGQTAILKHLLTLSPSTNWLNEVTSDGANWSLGPIVYSSPIVYLIYQANHTCVDQCTGYSYHSGSYHFCQKASVCTNCGTTVSTYYERVACSGPPCMDIIGSIPDEEE